MRPIYKAHLKNFGIGAVGTAGAIAGGFVAEVVWSMVRIAVEDRKYRKQLQAQHEELLVRIERTKQMIVRQQTEIAALEASPEAVVIYPQADGRKLYKPLDRGFAEAVEQKEPTVISGEKLEELGPFWGHDIYIHEDTQPAGKTRGDGCTFHIWDWKKELEERTMLQRSGVYHLTEDEFKENEYGFQQRYCTYYVDTNVLVDEDGSEYPWSPNAGFECVGPLSTVTWGRGSRRSDTVYLRNELVEEEYMIVREGEMLSLQLAVGERDGDDLNHLDGHKDPKGS